MKLKVPEGTFTLEKMKIEIEVDMLHFCELMENPAEFKARFPAVTLEHLLFLHESFVLIEPLSEKWGRWVISKCGCQGFFAGGICGHSLLLAMLYDRYTVTYKAGVVLLTESFGANFHSRMPAGYK